MRRIKLVVGALAIVVAALVALSGPAMAQQLECRDPSGFGIVCDGERYVPFDSDYYDYPDYSYGDDDDYYYFPPYAFNGYDYGYDSYYEDPEEYFDYLEEQVEELEELYEDYGYYGW